MNVLNLCATFLLFTFSIFLLIVSSSNSLDVEVSAVEKYGVICDAGSSGTRIFVYKISKSSENQLMNIDTLVKDGKAVVKKVSPGLSSFGNHPEKVVEYLKPLLRFAELNIPAELINETPLFIFATAGMRLLPESQKSAIIRNLREELGHITQLKFDPKNIQIIDGSWEGIYSWISVNYILGRLGNKEKKTVGMIDMGGASVQIAMQIENEKMENDRNIFEIDLGTGNNLKYRVFSTTFLGFGANQGLEKYEKSLGSPLDHCSPKGLRKVRIVSEKQKIETEGTGEWDKCVKMVRESVKKERCDSEMCYLDVNAPKGIDLSNTELFGFSEYWYTTRNFGSSGAYNYSKLTENVNEYCTKSWEDIKIAKQNGGFKNVEESRMETNCFKAAWIIAVLHDGFDVNEKKNQFQSVLEINGEEMQWALGAMIYHMNTSGNSVEGSIDQSQFMIASYVLVFSVMMILAFCLFREYHTRRRKISYSLMV